MVRERARQTVHFLSHSANLCFVSRSAKTGLNLYFFNIDSIVICHGAKYFWLNKIYCWFENRYV